MNPRSKISNPRSKISARAILALGVIAMALMSANPAAAHKKKHGDHGNKPPEPVVHPKPHPMPPGPVVQPKPPVAPKPGNVRDHRTPRPPAIVRDHRGKRWAGIAAAVKKKPVVSKRWAGAAAAAKKKTAP